MKVTPQRDLLFRSWTGNSSGWYRTERNTNFSMPILSIAQRQERSASLSASASLSF